jgi:hemolysin activation/secretion protein
MSVSSAGGVAAYPSGELSGDNAALVHVELGGPLQLNLSAFTDYGWARAADPLPGARRRTLGDVGLGLTAQMAGGLMRVQLAHRTVGGNPTSEPAARTRLLVQAGWVF